MQNFAGGLGGQAPQPPPLQYSSPRNYIGTWSIQNQENDI